MKESSVNLLLEPLALQVTQLLGARAHNIIRWRDVSGRLPGRPKWLVFPFFGGLLEHELTSRRSPVFPAGPVGGAPLTRYQPP